MVYTAFGCEDVLIDGRSFLGRLEELVCCLLDIGMSDLKRLGNSFDDDGSYQFGMFCDEQGHVRWVCRFSDVICDIECEEIAWSDETINGTEVDMVGV